MNKKLLCAALLAGLGVAQAASAQDATTQTFDNRWYVTGAVGYDWQDSNRFTKDIPFVTLGFGRFLSPNWSLDGELNYAIHPTFKGRNNIVNPDPTLSGEDLNWNQEGISLDLRRHFLNDGRSWHPYLLGGIGYQRSQEEYDNWPNPNSPARSNHGNVAAKVGIGMQGDLGRVAIRTELAARFGNDTGHANSDNLTRTATPTPEPAPAPRSARPCIGSRRACSAARSRRARAMSLRWSGSGTLSIPWRRLASVSVVNGDTGVASYERTTGASRTTIAGGMLSGESIAIA